MARSGPVFEVEGSQARFQVDDCVVAVTAPSRSSPTTLVATDNPRNLSWRGRGNLYSGLSAYLEPTRDGGSFPAITDFAAWRDSHIEVHETGDTSAVEDPVWKVPNPLQMLLIEQDDPTPAFELAARYRQRTEPYGCAPGTPRHATGRSRPARPAPAGSRAARRVAARYRVTSRRATRHVEVFATDRRQGCRGFGPADPGGGCLIAGVADRVPPEAGEDDPTALPAMPPMTTPPPDEPVASTTGDDKHHGSSTSDPPLRDRGSSSRPAAPSAPPDPESRASRGEDLIRTAEQFAATLSRLGTPEAAASGSPAGPIWNCHRPSSPARDSGRSRRSPVPAVLGSASATPRSRTGCLRPGSCCSTSDPAP